MSMWGHRVVEVTASKLNLGQLPLSTPESPAEAEDHKPQTLNWVKGELIGKGSYGRVYIALNISTGDMMAVKQVELPATERDRNDRKQLGQIESLRVEIALLKDMYHPNIVAYLGFETSPEYLSM
jgi:mitogen-activated protein kinase kinase kinase